MTEVVETLEPEFAPEWTKQDFLNLLTLDRAAGGTQLAQLLDDAFYWQLERELEEGEEGINDPLHMVESYMLDDGLVKRFQYVRTRNDEASLFRLGFSVEEVCKIVGVDYEYLQLGSTSKQ